MAVCFGKECCGCGACENICPKNAIKMTEDSEMFRYPQVNKELCVECGMCEKTCPLNYAHFFDVSKAVAYVGVNKDEKVLFNSSSGGAFTAIYRTYLREGYIVYGVRYDENNNVVHGSATCEDECEQFRKSKYVQSFDNGVYSKVADDLKNKKRVLFSGNSCQCAALYSFIKTKGISTDYLVTVTVLCHGVASSKLFSDYLHEEERRAKANIVKYTFKNKIKHGGRIDTRSAYVEFSNGKKSIRTTRNDPFLRGYYLRLIYRPSCGICRFARKERVSDYTIADAWGIQSVHPEFNPIEGASLILFNTEKAKAKIPEVVKMMKTVEVPLNWALNSQQLFYKPTEMHEKRDQFFEMLQTESIRKSAYKCTFPSLGKIIKHFTIRPISRIISVVKKR